LRLSSRKCGNAAARGMVCCDLRNLFTVFYQLFFGFVAWLGLMPFVNLRLLKKIGKKMKNLKQEVEFFSNSYLE
jgi:hypothetical protein